MSKHNLSENFEYEGIWWLPENPHVQVPGIVMSSGTEITLKLYGLLKDSKDLGGGELFAPNIILGKSQGKRFTLCPTFATEYPSHGFNSQTPPQHKHLTKSTFLITHMLIGAYFEKTSEMRFVASSLSFTDLEDWMDSGKLPFKIENKDDSYTVSYVREEPIRAYVQEIDAEVLVSWNLNRRESRRRLIWEREVMVMVNLEREQSIEWYLNMLRELRYLFTLLVGRPVYVSSEVTFHLSGEYETIRDGELMIPIQVFSFDHLYRLRKRQPWPASWSMGDVFVPLPSIQENFGQVVNKWFERAKILRPVLDSYINSLEETDINEETKFLILTQALEIYHRRTYATTRRNPPLKDRLEQLLKSVGIIKNYILKDEENLKHFSQKVADTRHYLVHGDDRKKEKSYRDYEYINASRRLQLLLLSLLLLELQGDYEIALDAVEKFASIYFVQEDW